MKYLIALATLALLAVILTPAWSAEKVAHNGRDEVRVTDAPCVNAGILSMIPKPEQEFFHAGSATLGGKRFEACWAPIEGAVYLRYEDGDEGIVGAEQFKPVRSL